MRVFTAVAGLFWATGAMACDLKPDENALMPDIIGDLGGRAQHGEIVLSEPFDLQLTFCGIASRSIRHIEVHAIMPAHQHGMNYTPVATPMDEGHFEVSNMLFHMPGAWDVKIAVFTDQAPVYFTLPLQIQ